MPLPQDHLALLIQLLKPATPELARRWLAALLLAPADQRPKIVEAVEAQLSRLFAVDPMPLGNEPFGSPPRDEAEINNESDLHKPLGTAGKRRRED